MLNRLRRSEGEKEDGVFGTHPGDIGVIVIAALLTCTWIAILILPSPFARLEQQQKAAEKAERQKKIDAAVATGEVQVGILPAKRP